MLNNGGIMLNFCIVISLFLLGVIVYLCICYIDTRKDPTPNITMSEDQEEIVTKLRKTERSEFESNLWNNICPLCGKDMELYLYGSFYQYSDHWCTHCGFITKMEVLA
jgi:hypothetical protein